MITSLNIFIFWTVFLDLKNGLGYFCNLIYSDKFIWDTSVPKKALILFPFLKNEFYLDVFHASRIEEIRFWIQVKKKKKIMGPARDNQKYPITIKDTPIIPENDSSKKMRQLLNSIISFVLLSFAERQITTQVKYEYYSFFQGEANMK